MVAPGRVLGCMCAVLVDKDRVGDQVGLSSTLLWFTDSGISLETGVYAAAVAPGSPAAKEGTLAVGDRIVAVSLGSGATLSATRHAVRLPFGWLSKGHKQRVHISVVFGCCIM